MRRTYQFEFTSTGECRYQGVIVLLGLQFNTIELEAYIIPDTDQESVELETAVKPGPIDHWINSDIMSIDFLTAPEITEIVFKAIWGQYEA